MEYYVYHEGKQEGPISLSKLAARLASGDFLHSDHVWHEGLSQSKPLSQLFQSVSQTEPPSQRKEQLSLTAEDLVERQPLTLTPDDLLPETPAHSARSGAVTPRGDTSSSLSVQQSEFVAAVPREIVQRIRASAAAEYPDDYSTQKWMVQDQCESFVAIHSLSAPDVPSAALDSICVRAANEHPDDYSTQKWMIEDQLQSYRDLNSG